MADQKINQGEQGLEDCIISLSEKLELANNLLKAILETTHDFIIFALDTEYRYISFNNRHREMAKAQWGQEIDIGMNMLDLIEDNEEWKNLKGFLDRVLAGEQFYSIEEHQDADGNVTLGKNHWAPVKDKTGEVTGIVCFIEDVTENKRFLKAMLEERKNQENVESLTFCDQLTGTYNRKYYEQELERLDNKCYYPLSIIVLSVNRLDQVNNKYGRAVGDLLIKQVGQILKNTCRGDDVVARLEGNEFVILMPKTAGANGERAIKRIKKIMDEANVQSIKLSVSFGYGTKYDETEDMNRVFEMAEKQLERLKRLEE
jgi:diguanylate cyclase (GGDEF)-like protein/PAS domain S-box-containing protein